MRKKYQIKFHGYVFGLLMAGFVPVTSYAQNTYSQDDSLKNYTLKEVEIRSQHLRVHLSPVPLQILQGKDLENRNSLSVADALRYFSGVQLKDYGGIGGLKTINVRSLGTHHTAVFYDGIAIASAQNGQVDLGKFSLSNMEEIRLYSGQQTDLSQSARAYSSASSIYLQSKRPVFDEGKPFRASLSLKSGSFGLINPALDMDYRLSSKVAARISSEHTRAHGRYKFRYSNGVYDTTAQRNNADIAAFRLEASLFGKPDSLSSWMAKYYHYQSERGLPGAIVANRFDYSQRLWDQSHFIHLEGDRKVSRFYRLAFKAKYSADHSRYLDPEYITTEGFQDNRYQQRETYLSLANEVQLLPFWSINLAADYIHSTLDANLYRFAYPRRNTILVALASEWRWADFNLQANLLGSFIDESVKEGPTANAKEEFTPAIMLNWKPFYTANLRFRAFYKSVFRMPSFNDLYYTFVGNSFLRPEYTKQYNMGISYIKSLHGNILQQLDVQADVYHNSVRDKIVAVPSSNLFRWTMMNLDEVRIRGLEINMKASGRLSGKVGFSTLLNYTWQQARDVTPDAYNFEQQIPYVPVHAASFTAQAGTERAGLNYSFIYTGERYSQKANIPVNYVEPWYTHDLSAWYAFRINRYSLRAGAEVNNLLNQYYDVVLNFPMPGRHYRFTLNLKL